jgi:hypothetical protein
VHSWLFPLAKWQGRLVGKALEAPEPQPCAPLRRLFNASYLSAHLCSDDAEKQRSWRDTGTAQDRCPRLDF